MSLVFFSSGPMLGAHNTSSYCGRGRGRGRGHGHGHGHGRTYL